MDHGLHSAQEHCLYFTANSLSRHVTEMAREELAVTGLDPSYAHLILAVSEEPGLSQSELAERLNLKPSTITRFVDKLERLGMVTRAQEGRNTFVTVTAAGDEKCEECKLAFHRFFERYCEVLGKGFAETLTSRINEANKKME